MWSSIAAGALLALTGCLMDGNYTCTGGAERGGPNNVCMCPEGTDLQDGRCVDAGVNPEIDSGADANEEDSDMADSDESTCDTCTPAEEAGPVDGNVSGESGSDAGRRSVEREAIG